MFEVAEMPYHEKLDRILGFNQLVEDFAPRLVREELGESKANLLHIIWSDESEPIPENASDKDKYEIAYRNFLEKWVSANNFMAKHKGEAGVQKFMHAAIAAWKRKYAGSALVLRIAWGIAPKFAFRTLGKRLAYQLQVFSPYTVSEFSNNRMVLKVTSCKIAGASTGFCVKACQNIVPAWLESQFNVNMNQNRQGNDCTVTFRPF